MLIMKRVATALVLTPVLALIAVSPPWVFFLIVVVMGEIALWEFYKLVESNGYRCLKSIGMVATFFLLYFLFFQSTGIEKGESFILEALIVSLLAVPISMVARVINGRSPEKSLEGIALTYFGILFVGFFLGHQILIRGMGDDDHCALGAKLLLFLYVVVCAGDIGAYYIGSSWGRRPLAPGISPKKSVEGAIGGIGSSALAAIAFALFFLKELPLHQAFNLGWILGIFGILGDLSESLLKRSLKAKDTGSILPGHGGLFDRIDSLIFAGPVLFYLLRMAMEDYVR